MSPSKTGCGRRTSSHPRFATAFCVRSVTDWPVTSASVKHEFISGLPNSVCARVLRVEMNRVRVHRQAREPDVVGGEQRAAERMLVDVADREVLEHASGPSLFDRHSDRFLPCASAQSCRGVDAELAENRVGVLAERRHVAHDRLDAVDAYRRQRRRAAGRRVSRCRASSRVPRAADGRGTPAPNSCARWRWCARSSRSMTSPVDSVANDRWIDRRGSAVPIPDARRVRREPLVVGELRPLAGRRRRNASTRARSERRGRHLSPSPVAERAVRRDRRVIRAAARRRRSAVAGVVRGVPIHSPSASNSDTSTALPRPVVRACEQRRQDAGVGIHAGGDVRDRDADLGRLLVRVPVIEISPTSLCTSRS